MACTWTAFNPAAHSHSLWSRFWRSAHFTSSTSHLPCKPTNLRQWLFLPVQKCIKKQNKTKRKVVVSSWIHTESVIVASCRAVRRKPVAERCDNILVPPFLRLFTEVSTLRDTILFFPFFPLIGTQLCSAGRNYFLAALWSNVTVMTFQVVTVPLILLRDNSLFR